MSTAVAVAAWSPAREPPPDAPERGVYVARGGESLWLVAATHGVPLWRLLSDPRVDASKLRSLPAGTPVQLPAVSAARVPRIEEIRRRQRRKLAGWARARRADGIHALGLGETLWDVARRYDISVPRLMEANALEEGDLWTLRLGTPIVLRGVPQAAVHGPALRAPVGELHAVNGADDFWRLAARHQVGVGAILALNGLSPEEATRLAPGSRVFVPASRADAGGARQPGAPELAAEAARLGLGTLATATRLYRGQTTDEWRLAAGPAELANAALTWPVPGASFVRGYGSGEGGYHLALDLAAPVGTSVRAAAPGIVAYADDDVPGYGELVLVVHPGGWITMYAHNSALHVVAGQRVAAGDVIAEVGSTGLSRGPHVHFELMHDGKNCDPLPLLPNERPGSHPRTDVRRADATRWSPGEPRPDAVRCAPRRHHPDHSPSDGLSS